MVLAAIIVGLVDLTWMFLLRMIPDHLHQWGLYSRQCLKGNSLEDLIGAGVLTVTSATAGLKNAAQEKKRAKNRRKSGRSHPAFKVGSATY